MKEDKRGALTRAPLMASLRGLVFAPCQRRKHHLLPSSSIRGFLASACPSLRGPTCGRSVPRSGALHPCRSFKLPSADGGWGGIACAALRLSRCARLELRSSSLSEFQAVFGRWRMGRDSNPRCIAAHTLSKRAHSTTLPPILEQGELNTMVGRAARRQQAFARFAVQALMAVMEGGQRCCRVRFTV
jgi:hypothetical protein